jgi:hypothetical protein
MIDFYFLNKNSIHDTDVLSMSQQILSIHLTTIFLISSKFYEIDDKLVFIKDVQHYY